MNRLTIYSTVLALALTAMLLGAFGSSSPLFQYLGSTTGVLLGFVLGVWWQEQERNRSHQEKIASFWREFHLFLPVLENKTQVQIATTVQHVFDSIIEYRLPLAELNYFRTLADELALPGNFRRKISELVENVRVLEEYVDFGAERISKWHPNFRSRQQTVYRIVLDLKPKA